MNLGPVRSWRDSFDVRVCTPNLCCISWDMMTFWHTRTDRRDRLGRIQCLRAQRQHQLVAHIHITSPSTNHEYRHPACARHVFPSDLFSSRSTSISYDGGCFFYSSQGSFANDLGTEQKGVCTLFLPLYSVQTDSLDIYVFSYQTPR